MTEDFLHFIWNYGLFERSGIYACNGEPVEVINTGEHNNNAGPDFLNARIRIGNTIWAGNVEIHVQSSDWYTHGHEKDKAYSNVILHVCLKNNREIYRSSGETIPVIELKFNEGIFNNYESLLRKKGLVPCRNSMSNMDSFLPEMWLNSLVVDRLGEKTDHLASVLKLNNNSWEDTFYIVLARAFGMGINAQPFEMLAESVSLRIIKRHRQSIEHTEALLFGQAGLLEESESDAAYFYQLQTTYLHLRHMYHLKPLDKHLWKFLRLRPVNFPYIRIAQLSALLYGSDGLFAAVTECNTLDELRSLFKVQASSFWNSHYSFTTSSAESVKYLGESAFQSLVINAVIPLLFYYGKLLAKDDIADRALEWLDTLPAESNRIVRYWHNFPVKASTALYSQGLLHLYHHYCIKKRCLACLVGARLIASKII